MVTQQDIDKMWDTAKAGEARRQAEWEALPEKEKKRRLRQYRDGFYERISEDPDRADDDGQSSST